MGYPTMDFIPQGPHRDRCAPDCDDQVPVFARVGRGLRGDGYKVEVAYDDDDETYLKGMLYDAATGEWSEDWYDPAMNINGGSLLCEYNLRPYTIPKTFTMTFRYSRPNRNEWQWTTPAIPYIWDEDDPDTDSLIGSGISSLFIRKTTDSWSTPQTSYTEAQSVSRQEKLLYPVGWNRGDFNAPSPGDPWTVNLSYGVGGDIDAPNIDDLSKILGISVNKIRSIVANPATTFVDFTDDNFKKYVDRRDNELVQHLHRDLGWGNDTQESTDLVEMVRANRYKQPLPPTVVFISPATVKNYINAVEEDLATGIDGALDRISWLESVVAAIFSKIPGASIDVANKTYSLPSMNIAIGDINIYSNSSTDGPHDNTGSLMIKTHDNVQDYDLWSR